MLLLGTQNSQSVLLSFRHSFGVAQHTEQVLAQIKRQTQLDQALYKAAVKVYLQVSDTNVVHVTRVATLFQTSLDPWGSSYSAEVRPQHNIPWCLSRST